LLQRLDTGCSRRCFWESCGFWGCRFGPGLRHSFSAIPATWACRSRSLRFGEAGLGHAVVIFAVMMMWHFTLGLWLVAGGGSPWRLVREPAMIGTLLGGLFLWQGWQTPLWLTHSLELLGQLAIPIMLITLGVAVARLSAGHLGRAFALTALRFVICLGVAAGLGLAFSLTPVATAVLIVQFTTPVAVTSYMLAAKYGADADAVASLVIASTVLSVGTLPLTLAFLI
jgi:predicted permease